MRREDRRVQIYVHRPDGSETTWTTSSFGTGLPHDLVHLVVERALGVRRGLWGLVCAGVDIARVNAMANRRGGPDKWSMLGDDIRELLWAEALANQPWRGEPFDDAAIEASLRGAAASLGEVATVPDAAARRRLREELVALHGQWSGLPPKVALVQAFPAPTVAPRG